ncbi:MAG: hypothetical protein ACE5K0_00595 [Candidatus Methanofastidiosia archaeon]
MISYSLFEKNIRKKDWLKTFKELRDLRHTGFAVLYFKGESRCEKSILIYKNGGILSTVYEHNGRIELGEESLISSKWEDCDGLMDVYSTSLKNVEDMLKDYENLYTIKHKISTSKRITNYQIPEGKMLGTLSLSLLSMNEVRRAILRKKLNGYIDVRDEVGGVVVFLNGEAFAALSGKLFGFKALERILKIKNGEVYVFEYENIDVVLKVGIPKKARLDRGERRESNLEKEYRIRIPTEAEIDEIMRKLAVKFGEEVLD